MNSFGKYTTGKKNNTEKKTPLNSNTQSLGAEASTFTHLNNFMDADGSAQLKRIVLMFVSCLACNMSLHRLVRRGGQQPATSEVYAVM